MRENYAGRIYDSGELDQRLDDVQGDEAVVVALMRLVGGGEGCGELCFIWVPKYHSTTPPQHHRIMHDKFVCHCGIIISAGTT